MNNCPFISLISATMRKAKRQTLLLLTCLIFTGQLAAQSYDFANQWIDPAQDYARFEVTEDGIYRVYAADLVAAGIDTTGMNPDNIHLTWRGEEEFIHVEKQGNQLDFIEFLGRRNDGLTDSILYTEPYTHTRLGALHPNLRINQFSDTSVYFFHVDSTAGLRMTDYHNMNYQLPPIEFYQESVQIDFEPITEAPFITTAGSQFDIFQSLNPQWTIAEGYLGPQFDFNNPLEVKIPTPNAFPGGQKRISFQVKGQSNWDHLLAVEINGTVVLTDSVHGAYTKAHSVNYSGAFPDTTTLRFIASGTQSNNQDDNYLTWVNITYQKHTDFGGGGEAYPIINVQNLIQHHFLDVDIDQEAWAWDPTQHIRNGGTAFGDTLKMWFNGGWGARPMVLATDLQLKSPRIVAGSGLSDLSNDSGAEFVLISSRLLGPSAQAYATYRDTTGINSMRTKVVFLDEIYAEFGYGSAHPLAIQRFCRWAMENWTVAPQFFFLWGKSIADIRKAEPYHVPTWGTPAADPLFVSNYHQDSTDFLPRVPIGRLPLRLNEQGFAYLEKVDQYEHIATGEWMRNGIFLSGGAPDVEQLPIQNYHLGYMMPEFESLPHYGRSLHYWRDSMAYDSTTTVSLRQAIEQGALTLTYFARMPDSVRLEEPEHYNVQERYPFAIAMDCGDLPSLQVDSLRFLDRWVLADKAGAIGAMRPTSAGFLSALGNYFSAWYRKAFTEHAGDPIGQVQIHAIDSLQATWDNQLYWNHYTTINLFGDPSIVLRTGTFNVWPGDANDDLIADVRDLLYVGLGMNATGPLRPNASNAWQAENAIPWPQAFTGSTIGYSNYAHADCDGNGTISALDTLPISLNYGLTHSKTYNKLTGTSSDPALTVVSVHDSLQANLPAALYVHLGDAQTAADSVHGIAFSLFYDAELVDSASVSVHFDSCWLGTPGVDLLTMSRHFHDIGRIDIGLTRTDGQAISGSGVIARVGIVVIDNISGKMPGDLVWEPLTVTPGNALALDASGNAIPLQGQAALVQVGSFFLPPLAPEAHLQLVPNPADRQVFLLNDFAGDFRVTVSGVDGKVVMERSFSEAEFPVLELSSLAAGMYVVNAVSDGQSFKSRLVIGR